MPTYEYACQNCDHRFEQFQSMRDEPLKTCPKCEQNGLKRLVGGGAGLIFKGSGFYITDYKNSGAKKDGGGDSKSSDSKSSANGSTPASSSKPSTDSAKTKST